MPFYLRFDFCFFVFFCLTNTVYLCKLFLLQDQFNYPKKVMCFCLYHAFLSSSLKFMLLLFRIPSGLRRNSCSSGAIKSYWRRFDMDFLPSSQSTRGQLYYLIWIMTIIQYTHMDQKHSQIKQITLLHVSVLYRVY